jgi:nucleoside-diphosphate-sugar epimerase
VVGEPGLDLHEWQTRWEELQEAAAEDPAGALPDIVRLVQQMLSERRYQLEEPVTVEGEDPDIVRDFLAARDVADAVNAGEADPEDVAVALENLSEIYEYLVADRRPP